MEIIFIVVGGAILGALARYTSPRRETYGVAVAPILGAIVSGIVWVGLTWAGLKWDGGWIWFITLLATAALVFAWVRVLSSRRVKADIRLFGRLTKA